MITILHNPRCSTSRAALLALEEAGVEHDVVRYLDTPLNEQAALDLFDILEDPFGDLVRRDSTFEQLGLGDGDVASREKVAELLAENPRLMQRPVLIFDAEAAIIGRPKERVPAFIEKYGTPAEAGTAAQDEIDDTAEEEIATEQEEAVDRT